VRPPGLSDGCWGERPNDHPISDRGPGTGNHMPELWSTSTDKYVEFYENVGAVVMRLHRSIRGNFCKPCVDRWFWDMTGKTFLLGWWGIISFIITPFILINNIVRYITSVGMSRPSIQLSRGPSPFWVFTTIAGTAIALLFVGSIALSFVSPISQEECAIQIRGYNTFILLTGPGAKSFCDGAVADDPDTFTRSYQPPSAPVVCSQDLDGLRATVVDTSSSRAGGNLACQSLYESVR